VRKVELPFWDENQKIDDTKEYSLDEDFYVDDPAIYQLEYLLGKSTDIYFGEKTIDATKLLDILPPNLRNDQDLIAAAHTIDDGFFEMVDLANNLVILPRISDLGSDLIDHLAYQTHVDFYETSAPLEVRRSLVENSLNTHRLKGTPAAVENLIETFFDDANIEEWFEYRGAPHHFRVVTSNSSVTSERADEFVRALDSVKRHSSKLEAVVILSHEEMELNFGGFVHIGSKDEYRQVT
jgi:phage tail P2-like protein